MKNWFFALFVLVTLHIDQYNCATEIRGSWVHDTNDKKCEPFNDGKIKLYCVGLMKTKVSRVSWGSQECGKFKLDTKADMDAALAKLKQHCNDERTSCTFSPNDVMGILAQACKQNASGSTLIVRTTFFSNCSEVAK